MECLSRRTGGVQFLIPIALLYVTVYLASCSVAYKLVALGPTLEPGPPFIFPLTYALSDILAEVYGSSITKKIIWYTLASEVIYALMVTSVLKLPSPAFWHHEAEYQYVFGHIIQFVFSGMVAVILSSFLSVFIISKLKVLMHGKHLWFRALLSSMVGGFFLVGTIILLAYANHLHSWKHAVRMFASIYTLEVIYCMVLIIPTWIACIILKKKEKIDTYDESVVFNPFKF